MTKVEVSITGTSEATFIRAPLAANLSLVIFWLATVN